MRNFTFRFKLNGETVKKNSTSEAESPNQIEYEKNEYFSRVSQVYTFFP